MFFKSQRVLTTALNLMVNHTDKLQLMSNIFETLHSVDTREIEDEYIKKLFETCRSFSKALMDKGIKTSDEATMYFDNSNLDEDMKSVVKEGVYFTEEIIKDYTMYFARMKHIVGLKKSINNLSDKWEEYQAVGVSDIANSTEELFDAASQVDDIISTMHKDTNDISAFIINPEIEDNKIEEYGINQLEEEILNSSTKKLKTDMWMDNITGGGFHAKSLYVVAGISGGFKSGWMQNMAEYMSMANDPKIFKVPHGSIPAILYVNLEMVSRQLISRRLSFYGEDAEDIIENNKGNLTKKVRDVLIKNKSVIPIVYQKSEEHKYSANQLRSDIKLYEKNGYQIIALVVDYSDLMKYVPLPSDELERISPLVRKNMDLRSIARDFNIPVLTGIQLNRGSSELEKRKYRAHKEDILEYMTTDNIAKSFDVVNVPEQIYFCYKFPTPAAGDFFSIVVAKDRDGKSKFIDKEGKEIKPKKNRVHYVARMDGIRITNDYSNTIGTYDTGDDTIVTTISLSEEELKELEDEGE